MATTLFLQMTPHLLINMGQPPSPLFDATGWPSTHNDGKSVQQHIVTKSNKEMDDIMVKFVIEISKSRELVFYSYF